MYDSNGKVSVSVVIPTYNRAHVLRRAIDSVLAQTFVDFEVLVIDDGSDDDTERVVADYTDQRIKFHRLAENSGVSAARNFGMRLARGEFIAFLDSDDEFLPTKIEKQVAKLRLSGDEIALVTCGIQTVNNNSLIPKVGGQPFKMILCRHPDVIVGPQALMLRRALVTDELMFDTALPAMEDRDFVARWVLKYVMTYVPEVLVRLHRTTGNRVSSHSNVAQALTMFRTKYDRYIQNDQSLRSSLAVQEAIAWYRVDRGTRQFRRRLGGALASDKINPRLLGWYGLSLLGRRILGTVLKGRGYM